ncbi:MAG TPA: hypothetical protein PKK48_01565 [Phycisphaerae bacterium]|nr:hypothetical protein [Phycisphaerae bacterium]HPS53854.1 hypothetical protein [Phycisphaerae bacterium]
MSQYSSKDSSSGKCAYKDGVHEAFDVNGHDNDHVPARDVLKLLDKELAAKLTAALYSSPLIRKDLVNRVKMEILAGIYETPERIEGTIDRLLEEFNDNWL